MNLDLKLSNAKEADLFADLSPEEKAQADFMADIAIIIHTSRMEMGMSQAEFARYLNVSQSMVSKWESGDYNFTVQTLVKIFATFGCSVSLTVTKLTEKLNNETIEQENSIGWYSRSATPNSWNQKATAKPSYVF